MPIRTASLNKKLQNNGARLHHAIAARADSEAADRPASEQEQALLEERRLLKQAKADRLAQAHQPRPKAAMMTRTTRPLPKEPKPKAAKEPKEAKAAKASAKEQHKPSRADKLAKKAENLESAKQAARKSAHKSAKP